MRIGIVCPYSLSQPGGVQGQVLGLARALRRRGHQVRVLGPCDGAPPEVGITPLGPAIPMETNGSIAPLAPDAATQMRLVRALWSEGFDVVHVHEPLAPGASITAMLLKSAPLVGTFHASGDFSNYQWLRRLCSWGASHLDIKVAVSKDAKRTAEEWFDDECTVLFNGVDTHRLVGLEPWPTRRRSVLFVGRHEERKGLETLLTAADHLPEDVVVWVAGTGPLTEELKLRYAHNPRVEWLGRVSDPERDRRLLAGVGWRILRGGAPRSDGRGGCRGRQFDRWLYQRGLARPQRAARSRRRCGGICPVDHRGSRLAESGQSAPGGRTRPGREVLDRPARRTL